MAELVRVAIADDSLLIRMVLTKALQASGYEPEEVLPTTVFDVLKTLRASTPALLITDLHMPACPGLSLIRAIREDPNLCDLPILVHSAHLDSSTAYCLQELGVNGVVSKPMNPLEIEPHVRKALAGNRWHPSAQMATIALVEENRARGSHLAELVKSHGLKIREIEPVSAFDVLSALLEQVPSIVLISLSLPKNQALSLIRLIREDPRLTRLPIGVYGRPSEDYPRGVMDRLAINGFLELNQSHERIHAELLALLENR